MAVEVGMRVVTDRCMRRCCRAGGALSLALSVAVLLGGCAGRDAGRDAAATTAASAPSAKRADDHKNGGGGHAGPGGLPSAHVHGVAVNPADNRIYLATHDGLFRYDAAGPIRIGPVIDLMGFTVAGPDHFYASGHPGPGTDLPEPVGLIESADGGRTWALRSRQGQSDFHAFTASSAGVVGFDGILRRSADGTSWTTLTPPVKPYALAASPDGSVVLATSESGPARSTDGGTTWRQIDQAPLLQVVDWGDAATVVGVRPDGTVAASTDGGVTWATRARAGGAPQAVSAHTTSGGSLRVIVVTVDAVMDSSDGGVTFAPLRA
jgi:hypothetical protein